MKRYISKLGLVILTLATLAPAGIIAAQERPFQLSGDGALLFDPSTQPSGPFAASGYATHLGAWDNEGQITFVPLSPTTLETIGSVTFTAANGDEIDMVFDGVLDVSTGQATGTFVIVGGSGRFADATGVSEMELQHSPGGGFHFTLDGVISY